MRKSLRVIPIVLLVLVCGRELCAETPAEHDQRMAWWRDARFGMFIHWGIMSIPGKDFNAMEKDHIAPAEYEKLVAQYNPVKWNAHEVVKMAKDAGQKYIVFVAKHHDGFCMWDTKLTDYNIMQTPYRQDIVRQLVEECAKQGMVFCFYYSLLDWHHPDANKERWPRYVDYMKGQLRELLTHYGPIGVVWFDGDWIPEWTDEQGRELARYIWSLQPKTIINNRIGKGRQDNSVNVKKEAYGADFGTPEQELPANGVPGYDWESCMTINNSWSWHKSDVQYKSKSACIRMLVDTASKGGNLLLNIGPQPDGSIPQPQQDRLRELGQWMRVNHESIHGTSASPFPQPLSWGRCTQKRLPNGNTRLYLHVFDWPQDGRLVVPGLKSRALNACLLADPQHKPLTCTRSDEALAISLPAGAPDADVSTIALDLEGSKHSGPSSEVSAASQPGASRVLTKLPEKFCPGVMECTPILFQGRLLLFGCYRPSRDCGFAPETNYLGIYDPKDGRELSRFGVGHSLGCAIVEGDTVHVFAPDSKGRPHVITKDNWFQDIQHFSSTDLKTWNRELAIPRADGEHLLNSSVCRDEEGYFMAYETDVPVSFCFKFARSKDLSHWEKIPDLAFTGEKKEYSACPVVRYFKPYYYAIYLHAPMPGHNGWVSFLARSRDLATWQLSPKNPILEAGEGEGSNNSDVDLIEIDAKTYVYYATGDQATWGDLKRAVYPGPMHEFFESCFPAGERMIEVSAQSPVESSAAPASAERSSTEQAEQGAASQSAAREFRVGDNAFLLNGKPLLIRAGELHPCRIPSEYWADRLKKARAMGLNTVAMYCFWNVSEPEPGQFDFTGFNDVARFVRQAQEEGLFVILRPGPYSCAERDFGGYPYWLLKEHDLRVRSRDERFLQAAARYMQRLGKELAPLQITRGGPILMVQVENEYGSYALPSQSGVCDEVYKGRIRDMIREAGFEAPLFTSDGPPMMAGGYMPDALPALNGSTGQEVFDILGKYRPNGPFFVAEFYPGGDSYWGKPHMRVDGKERAQQLDWYLAHDVSFNIYMLQGGTNFGFSNGANYFPSVGEGYQPQPTSYDRDWPMDDAGRPYPKYFQFRDVIAKHLPPGETLPDLPPPIPTVEISPIVLDQAVRLFDVLGKPVLSEKPLSMEDVNQAYGYILYRTKLPQAIKGILAIEKLRDYGVVFLNGKRVAELDRRLDQNTCHIDSPEPNAALDILVENMGRVNYGPELPDNRKGITEKVALDDRELTGWEIYPLPMTNPAALAFNSHDTRGPAFYRGQFALVQTGDTFLDMRGWGKGCVWINGHNLGRFWHIGPQQTLYLPGVWLKKGANEIIVFDLQEHAHRSVCGLKDAILDQLQPSS